MINVSFNDKQEYASQERVEGIWYPECPECGAPHPDGVEKTVELSTLECSICEKNFTVKGVGN